MTVKQSAVGRRICRSVDAGGGVVRANGPDACKDLPSHSALRDALIAARDRPNGGFGLEMWATVVIATAWSAPWRLPAAIAATSGPAAA